MVLRHHKHKEYDKESQWHLYKQPESLEHHLDESSSSSSSSSSHHWDPPKHEEHCVEEILKAILHAQKKAKKLKECDTSCKESIHQLLGKSDKPKKNTIPFILYCEDCKPFKATGVTTLACHTKKEKFECITSFIFRIKAIDQNCAVLELLTFKNDMKCSADVNSKCKSNDSCSPCCQINGEDVDHLIKTGICITVDLSCFCAITCLPAVCL